MTSTAIDPALQRLIDRVQTARAVHAQLDIRGGGSKRFYGEEPRGEPLEVGELRGISSYDPSELVVSVRAGTPLAELEDTLAAQGQCLPFEPPRFAAAGTVGGMVAAGLAGPARAAVGGVRDYLLGATVLNGRAEVLSFGGQVIKNVAGYDLSRVLAGSMGILGVICEVSLKVLPIAPAALTLRFDLPQAQALDALNRWAGQPLPLSASAWHNDVLVVRLAGARAAVQSASTQLGGQALDEAAAAALWAGLRDHRDEFFAAQAPDAAPASALWRLSLPCTTAPLALPGATLIEWGGAQRWLRSDAPAGTIREAADRAGGHAVLFRGPDKSAGVFAPLSLSIGQIHRALKAAFDPDRVFNPGRLYPDL
jgi:glycolate oxidase FAD binding subunit